MCGPAVGLGLSVVGSIMGQRAQEKQVKAQQQAVIDQAGEYIKGMNFSFQQYEMERQDAFDQAVTEILNTRQEGQSLSSQVEAILGDAEKTGRTADLIQRDADAQSEEAIDNLKDNYGRKSNEIDINKEMTLLNTQGALKGLQSSMPKAPNRLGMLANIGTSIASYANLMENIKRPNVDNLNKNILGDSYTNSILDIKAPLTTPFPNDSAVAADSNRIRMKYGGGR